MAVTQLAGISRFPHAVERDEYSFNNVDELAAFLQGEIIASKMKFMKLAAKADVCPSTVSKLAYGVTKSPRAATCFGILAALGWHVVVRR